MTNAEIDSKCLYLAKQFLDDEVYGKFKRNVLDPEVSENNREALAEGGAFKPYEVIDNAFGWAGTLEGHEYWSILYSNLENYTKVSTSGWFMGWDEDNFDDLDLSLDI